MVDYVVDGTRTYFRVGFDYSSHTCKKAARNMRSALEKPEVVRDYLVKECAEGRVVRLLEPPMVHVSCFRVIPTIQQGSGG